MRTVFAAVVLSGLICGVAHAQHSGLGSATELVDRTNLRVCADPGNMPFSSRSGEGFENKLAELLAAKLGRKRVEYTWFPQATGFVRMTLSSRRCDVIIGYPQGDELVQNTNPYYSSAYAMVFKPGNGLDGIKVLEDPRLKQKRIGVVAGTPPATNLAQAGLMGQVRPYQLMIDTRINSSARAMIADLKKDVIDIAVLWGPMAGYFAREAGTQLNVVPLIDEKTGSRMVYRITMGVRPSDQEWKRELNRFIKEYQKEINAVLLEYGVPLLDQQDRPITE